MKNLSIASIIEKNKLQSDQAWLVALKIHVRDPATNSIVDTIRVVRNTEDTVIKSGAGGTNETYVPFPFDISVSETSNELPTLKVTIQDQTQIVQSYMNAYGGGIGFDVDLYVVRASTATSTVVDPELVEYFTIIKSSVSNYVVNWDLGAENPLRQSFPRRRQNEEQCSFKYKDPNTCAYGGSLESCDFSLNGPNGCRVHNNAANYGGYPGIIARG